MAVLPLVSSSPNVLVTFVDVVLLQNQATFDHSPIAVVASTSTFFALLMTMQTGSNTTLVVRRNVSLCSEESRTPIHLMVPLLLQDRMTPSDVFVHGFVNPYFLALCGTTVAGFSFIAVDNKSSDLQELVFGDGASSVFLVPVVVNTPKKPVALSGNFNQSDCVVFLPRAVSGATPNASSVLTWEFCTQMTVNVVVYAGFSPMIISDTPLNAVTVLVVDVVNSSALVESAAPHATAYSLLNDHAFLCMTDVEGVTRVMCVSLSSSDPSKARWTTSVPSDCSTFLEVSEPDSSVLLVGGVNDNVTAFMTVIDATSGRILVSFSPFVNSICNYGENNPLQSLFQAPLFSVEHGVALALSQFSNCMYMASVVTGQVAVVEFGFADILTLLLHEPGTDLLVFQAVNSTGNSPSAMFVFGSSISQACSKLPPLGSHGSGNVTGVATWSSFLPYCNRIAVAFGGVFYVSTILNPSITLASAVNVESTIWTAVLHAVVTIPVDEFVGLLPVEDMICSVYSSITCFSASTGSRRFSIGKDYWGTPFVTAKSEFLFVGKNIRAFNYETFGSWLATDDSVNYGGHCGRSTFVIRGDVLFVVCQDAQLQLPRLFVLNMEDGTFLLGSGPTVAPSTSLLVSRSSSTILMTAFSDNALLSLVLSTVTTNVILQGTEYFCASSDDTFYTFALNWEETFFNTSAPSSRYGFAGQATPFDATSLSLVDGSVQYSFSRSNVTVEVTKLLGSACSILLPVLNPSDVLGVLLAILYPAGSGQPSPPSDFSLYDGTHKVIIVGQYKLSSSYCAVMTTSSVGAPVTCSVELMNAVQFRTFAVPPVLQVMTSPRSVANYASSLNLSYLVMNSTLLLQIYQPPVGNFPVVCSNTVSNFITDNFDYCYVTAGYTLILSHYNATSAVTVFSKVLYTGDKRFVDYSMQIRLPTIYEAPIGMNKSGSVIISPFLLFLALRPDQNVLPNVGTVESAFYGNDSISLEVRGLDGDTIHQDFTSSTCAVPNANRCPDIEQYDEGVTFVPDTTYRSATWDAAANSLWGSGFARLGQTQLLSSMRKSTGLAQQQSCNTIQTENSTLCEAPCLPNHSSCLSVVQHRLTQFLYAYVTEGSDDASINITRFSSISDAGFVEYGCLGNAVADFAENFAQKPQVELRCGASEVVFYAPWAGNIVIYRAKHGVTDPYLLVKVSCTACVFFFSRGVSAAPFSWNFVGAIKSLLVVLLAYAFTRRFPSAMLSIKVRYANMVTLLGNFRANDEGGKAAFRDAVVRNFSPTELSADDIAQRLQALLSRRPPQEFVEFFEWNLCHDRQWIFRDKATIPLEEMEHYSEIVFALLRVYDAYTPSVGFDSASDTGSGDSWVILNHDDDHASEISFQTLHQSRSGRNQTPSLFPSSQPAINKSSKFSFQLWNNKAPAAAAQVKSTPRGETFSSKFMFLKSAGGGTRGAINKSASTDAEQRELLSSFDERRPATAGATRSTTASDFLAPLTDGSLLQNDSIYATGPQSLMDAMLKAQSSPRNAKLDVACSAFLELRDALPEYFEYALLPSRTLDVRLVPVPIVLVANLFYCVVFVLMCIGGQAGSSTNDAQPLSWFDRYQVVYFQILNSTAVGSLLVDSVVRVTLRRRHDFKLMLLLQNPYVCASLLLILPPLITHCLIGAVLYVWVIGPLLGLPLYVNYLIQNSHFLRRNSTITILFVLRSATRVAIIFSVCTALSLSFNYTAYFLYRGNPNHYDNANDVIPPQQQYLNVLGDDYNARSYACMFEEWTATVQSVMQHFSALIGIF